MKLLLEKLSLDRRKTKLRWLNTVLQKIEDSRIRLVFLDCYFLMNDKEYITNEKQRPKGSNLFTEATQLSLLWQRWRSKMADILDLKPYNSKTISVTPKFYLIK